MMLAKLYTNNKVDTIYNLKIIMINFIYSKENITLLMQCIQERLESSSINFYQNDMSINVRIKKINTKKIVDFVHNPLFYYNYLSDIFIGFLSANIENIKNKYIEIFGYNKDDIDFIEELCTTQNYCHLINILTFNNNIIIKL
jgi:hypothetical protein